ncbi:DUF1566 domain-containing protein [bacterium]|nr:DUF1566 domain-containing protein [bacterium]
MKLKATISFLILCAAIFFTGCSDGNKTDYPENDDEAVSDTDSVNENDDADTADDNTEADTGDDTETDTDSGNDTDTDSDESDTVSEDDADSGEPSGDADSEEERPDDSDSANNDADSVSDNDTDSDTNDDADSGSDDDVANQEIQETNSAEVLCTGQSKCFDKYDEIECPAPSEPFFGQDTQYAEKGYCVKRSFTTTEDLVTDNITGLVWQRNLPETYSGCSGSSGTLCAPSEAVSYCNNLNYAGYSDWRLPTPAELGTIVDYGKTNPSIDSEIFPNTPGRPFWTSDVYLYDTDKNWALDFLQGKIDGNKTTGSLSYLYVRCVRGEGTLKTPSFKVSGTEGEEIVTDSVNNLVWTKSFGGNQDWESALKYCRKIGGYAGFYDWRLPNINELKTMINYYKFHPASDFEGMDTETFWSSTSYTNNGEKVWAIRMAYGSTMELSKENSFKVICVRQRF